jgi:hypothetical protein
MAYGKTIYMAETELINYTKNSWGVWQRMHILW